MAHHKKAHSSKQMVNAQKMKNKPNRKEAKNSCGPIETSAYPTILKQAKYKKQKLKCKKEHSHKFLHHQPSTQTSQTLNRPNKVPVHIFIVLPKLLRKDGK
jgi:hypothetical protein